MNPSTVQPSPEIPDWCSCQLWVVHKALRSALPREEHPSLRQRRCWKILDGLRDVVESIDLELRQGRLGPERKRPAVRP